MTHDSRISMSQVGTGHYEDHPTDRKLRKMGRVNVVVPDSHILL